LFGFCLFGWFFPPIELNISKAGKLYKANKLYDVLGLARDASGREIKTAFKKMSLQCHPDKCVCFFRISSFLIN
jgi:preprotein translocase subunit Sec63